MFLKASFILIPKKMTMNQIYKASNPKMQPMPSDLASRKRKNYNQDMQYF